MLINNNVTSVIEKNIRLFNNNSFKIMQLTDIHLGVQVDNVKEMKFIRSFIEENKPDLIVITGDTFLDANKSIVKFFFDKMEAHSLLSSSLYLPGKTPKYVKYPDAKIVLPNTFLSNS